MPRQRTPNPARIHYDRVEMHALLVHTGMVPQAADVALDVYERRRAEGADMPCQAEVHHGPGHQSSTYCQVRGGSKGHDKGPKGWIHYADLPSGGHAEWTDDDPYAEYWG